MTIARVKGTHDILDLSVLHAVLQIIRTHVGCYSFHEIETPILEQLALFQRSLGQVTDVVSKEMFILESRQQEKEESEVLCLRPELTASTMRAFLEHAGNLQLPWKVFSYGPLFRYERPQKGRYRQFHQVNMEIIGAACLVHDVQLITMLDRLFQEKFHLDNYALLVNFLGCQQDRAAFKTVLAHFLESVADKLCSLCHIRKEQNMLRVFDCKNSSCATVYEQAPHIADHLCSACSQEWQQVQEQLQHLSVSFTYQPKLVRGLDYYDKTVFEFVASSLGAQQAFCGGGRYDRLAQQLGSHQPYPALGAAVGMERLLLLLEPFKDKLALSAQPALHCIIPLSAQQCTTALLLADTLRAKNICVDILYQDDSSLKHMLRKASKLGATYCLMLGSEEQQARSVMVKNMVTGHQELVKQIDVAAYVSGKK